MFRKLQGRANPNLMFQEGAVILLIVQYDQLVTWRVRVGTGLAGGSIPSMIRWNCLYVRGGFPAFISMILQFK